MAGADDPRSTCFVCNEPLGQLKLGPTIAWANDQTPTGDINFWAVFAHPECIRRVAHPDIDLDASAASGFDPET
jgi:hypothetical protein